MKKYYLWFVPILTLVPFLVIAGKFSSLLLVLIPILNWAVIIGLLADSSAPVEARALVGVVALFWCALPLVIRWYKTEAETERQRIQDEERGKREEQERMQAHRLKQTRLRAELDQIGERAIENFESLPRLLRGAETLLDEAERDFSDRAFAPFWTAVQSATTQLGLFKRSVDSIRELSTKHLQLRNGCDFNPGPFPLHESSIRGLAVSGQATERLAVIVRRAQRDFEFSTIYEQRRTNALLVQGFSNLGDALDRMAHEVSAAILSVSDQVTESGSKIAAGNASLVESVEASHQLVERHDRALQMLDNLQRRRVVVPRQIGDGAY